MKTKVKRLLWALVLIAPLYYVGQVLAHVGDLQPIWLTDTFRINPKTDRWSFAVFLMANVLVISFARDLAYRLVRRLALKNRLYFVGALLILLVGLGLLSIGIFTEPRDFRDSVLAHRVAFSVMGSFMLALGALILYKGK